QLLPLLVVARPELALHAAADRLQRRRGDDAFGRPADAVEHVDAGPALARGDRGRNVAVADQAHLRPCLAELADPGLVAVPFEYHDPDRARRDSLRLRGGA